MKDRSIDGLTDGLVDVLIDGSMVWWINWLVNRLIDRWIDWCIYGWMVQCIYGSIDQCIDRLIGLWIDRSMDSSIEWSMDGWINGSMDRWIDGWIYQMIYESMDRWIDGLSTATPPPSSLTPPATTDFTNSNTFLPRKYIFNVACLCFGSISAVSLVSSFSLEQKSSSAREGGANLAVPIGTTTSCKCIRKLWFVFYSFLWTCR